MYLAEHIEIVSVLFVLVMLLLITTTPVYFLLWLLLRERIRKIESTSKRTTIKIGLFAISILFIGILLYLRYHFTGKGIFEG